jgi:hypothetical protein
MPPRKPVHFSPEKFDDILAEIMDGTPLSKLTGQDRAEGMPSRRAFNDWVADEKLNEKHDLSRRYQDARNMMADVYFEEIVEIADEELPTGCDPAELNAEIQRRKQRIDSRKFTAGRMRPWLYGDQTQRAEIKQDGPKVIHRTVELHDGD